MSKGVQMAVATLVVFGAIVWMVTTGEGSFQFFNNVGQLSEGDYERESGLRVRGFVVGGTIVRDLQEQVVTFAISDAQEQGQSAEAQSASRDVRASYSEGELKVRYDGIDVPDLFADGAEVVVEGGFRDGVFVASKIFAKCPSKYEVEQALPEQKA